MKPRHWRGRGPDPEKYTVLSGRKDELRSTTPVQFSVIHHGAASAKYMQACIPAKLLEKHISAVDCEVAQTEDKLIELE